MREAARQPGRQRSSARPRCGAPCYCNRRKAITPLMRRLVTALDYEQERKLRLLLLGRGAASAHRFERSLAAELDDDQQSRRGARRITTRECDSRPGFPRAMACGSKQQRGEVVVR